MPSTNENGELHGDHVARQGTGIASVSEPQLHRELNFPLSISGTCDDSEVCIAQRAVWLPKNHGVAYVERVGPELEICLLSYWKQSR
jgi:hypothetical protein